ncbi:MAG: flagellar motor switch protein FliN [Gallionellales bacterium GWA2_59_43]|nr:MAG: flagellar motor switch protein FliN [Gallionellales bacterium GWA2_59_43]
MADETGANEDAITADDWGAAMAEQTSTTAADDWGAAMAEQTAVDSKPVEPAKPHVFEKFGAVGSSAGHNDLDMILDIPVQLTVELGRTKMPIKNLLQLAQGSVVELAGMAGEPLDVLINGFLIAQGEVVVVNDKLGIRLTDIITPSERLRRLNR